MSLLIQPKQRERRSKNRLEEQLKDNEEALAKIQKKSLANESDAEALKSKNKVWRDRREEEKGEGGKGEGGRGEVRRRENGREVLFFRILS